jgi:hypothetical protein
MIAMICSVLTYWFVERPIRFGKKARVAKAVVLLTALFFVGVSGVFVYWKNGLIERSSVQQARAMIDSESAPSVYESCHVSMGNRTQCRYHNVSGDATIALLGDSHADMMFRRIYAYNSRNGINTLLVFSTGPWNVVNGADRKRETVDAAFDLIANDNKINKVFLVVRGVKQGGGSDLEQKERDLQESVNRLRNAGKKVLIVAENPELPFNPRSMLKIQPFRSEVKDYHLKKSDVLREHENYLAMLGRITGGEIIYVLDAFCPKDECLFFDEQGLPLYRDDDHLSNAGVQFLIEKVLAPYLGD